MGKIVTLLVGINAALGIATYLGVRIAVSRSRERVHELLHSPDVPETQPDVQRPVPGGLPPAATLQRDERKELR